MKSELSPTMAALKKETPSSEETALSSFFSRKTRYKFWVLAAILLLAFWSMFIGSVSLKWSAGTFSRFYDGPRQPIFDDLDILVLFSAISWWVFVSTVVYWCFRVLCFC